VFEVRAMVESAMVRQLCARANHRCARRCNSGRTCVLSKKPSGALMFRPHAVAGRLFVLLARLLGNEVLAQLLAICSAAHDLADGTSRPIPAVHSGQARCICGRSARCPHGDPFDQIFHIANQTQTWLNTDSTDLADALQYAQADSRAGSVTPLLRGTTAGSEAYGRNPPYQLARPCTCAAVRAELRAAKLGCCTSDAERRFLSEMWPAEGPTGLHRHGRQRYE
jgi:hypothetical protein